MNIDKEIARKIWTDASSKIDKDFEDYWIEQQGQVKNLSIPDAEQCLKIQEQVKQYCYTDEDDNPVISYGGIRTIIRRWKHMVE